jgi:transposase
LVARQHGLTAAQLFQWRKAYLEALLVAVGANETVVPASELQEAMIRIKQLEAALGRKTLENEILKEAVDFTKAKKGLRSRLYCPGTSRNSRVNVTGRIEQKLIDQKSEFNLTSRFPAITNFGLNY